MSIRPDWWIRERAKEGMIEPFTDRLERRGVISYGLSSFGYDLRAAPEWRIFVNAFNTVVDPKHFDTRSLIEHAGEECIIPPNSFVLTRSVEYLRIPDDTMVVALGKSSYARCFRGDTQVALVDGTSRSLETMADEARDGALHFGYALGPNGRLIATLLDAPRFVGRDALVEVTLDDGGTIHATPDHRFMLRDGSWLPAWELAPGMALMPLYRDVFRGYEMTYQPLTGTYAPTHRLADAWNVRNGVYADEPGTHRHHVDHDRRNNHPANLVRMPASEHVRYHNAETYGGDFDPVEHGASIRARFTALRRDPAWRTHLSNVQRERAESFWTAPQYAARRADVLRRHRERWNEAEREAQRQRQVRFWHDNASARGALGDRSRDAWSEASPERRRRQAEYARSLRLRPDIDASTVREALDATGSIRGAARLLDRDRNVFRRFPEVLAAFRGVPAAAGSYRNHRVASVRPLEGEEDVYCLTVPEAGNFALEAGVFVANCGIVANVTPLEPGWEGHVTLELSNTTPLPAKVYGNEGIVQLLFFQGDRPEVTYGDRKGKYQGQTGITLPRLGTED
ncbi:MAG: hypothetical protein P1P87_02715 [Trueperaceae bacterium]|nr:hypothetical protein [Trueperaceae bacterium]